MSARAVSIVARKSAAAAILSGDDLDAGLMEFDSGMSLFQQLAASVKAEEHVALDDVRALFQKGSAAVNAEFQNGHADLGIDAELLNGLSKYRTIVMPPVPAPQNVVMLDPVQVMFEERAAANVQRAISDDIKERVERRRDHQRRLDEYEPGAATYEEEHTITWAAPVAPAPRVDAPTMLAPKPAETVKLDTLPTA